jgi:hypothetical protein
MPDKMTFRPATSNANFMDESDREDEVRLRQTKPEGELDMLEGIRHIWKSSLMRATLFLARHSRLA